MTWVEIEIARKNRKIFLLVNPENEEMWVDLAGLPQTAFLCAMCDAIPFMETNCGEKGNIKRTFVSIEWVINDWGGDQEIVEAIKKRKQMTLDDLPRLREKYCPEK